MDLFLVGLVCGLAMSIGGFVIWNLERPADLDEAEDVIRDKTPEYENAKADLSARLRKLRKDK